MNQVLFTGRRALYGVSIAMAGFAAASVKMGMSFNSSMEQNTIAMTQFLGSAQAAKTELNYLYKLAATTPFEFAGITDTTRRFLAFGFTLKDTNRYLKIMGDTAAAFGGNTDQIERMALVFGQMHSAGRVLGQDMLQLEQIGLPIPQILREQLGLTQKQLANIGQLQIPADIAIEAIMRGLNQRYQGMAAKQAKTLQGQLSNLHDYAEKLFGTITMPLYSWMEHKFIPRVNNLVGELQKAGQTGGFWGIIDFLQHRFGLTGPFGIGLVKAIKEVIWWLKYFWWILTNLIIPTLKHWVKMLAPVFFMLYLVAKAIAWLSKQLWLSQPILNTIIGLFILYKVVGMAVAVVNTWIAFTTLVAADTTEGLTVAMVIAKGAAYAYWLSLQLVNFIIEAMPALIEAARVEMLVWQLWIEQSMIPTLTAMWELLGPIGWLALALTVLTTLYFKWKGFRDVVNSLWHNIIYYSPIIAAALTIAFGPLGVALTTLLLIIRYHKQIEHWGNTYNRLTSPAPQKAFQDPGMGFHGSFQLKKVWGIPIGFKSYPQWSWGHHHSNQVTVGQNTAAGVSIPGVTPLPDTGPLGGVGGFNKERDLVIHNYMQVDGKTLAQAVAKANRDAQARR